MNVVTALVLACLMSLGLTTVVGAQDHPAPESPEVAALQAQLQALVTEVQELRRAQQAATPQPTPKEQARKIRDSYHAVCTTRGLKFDRVEVSSRDNTVVIICK